MDNSSENQHNILTMTDQKPHSGYAPLSLVEAYWDALRVGREMPKRAEIDPRGIESALAHAFILERVAPGVARMRIAGSHLHDLLGMEARGMPVTTFFTPDTRTRIARLLEEVFQTPATAQVSMHAPDGPDGPALAARMILLPLKSDLGDVSRILGCLVSIGEIGHAPRHFDLDKIKLKPLGSAASTPAQGFAESGQAFDPAQRQSTLKSPEKIGQARHPHLRLIVSND
tara:strand:- start:168 stop:854 length:687 start_codon:yes stop_codon:yes gene_type:complete